MGTNRWLSCHSQQSQLGIMVKSAHQLLSNRRLAVGTIRLVQASRNLLLKILDDQDVLCYVTMEDGEKEKVHIRVHIRCKDSETSDSVIFMLYDILMLEPLLQYHDGDWILQELGPWQRGKYSFDVGPQKVSLIFRTVRVLQFSVIDDSCCGQCC